jgi:hypothetical protein
MSWQALKPNSEITLFPRVRTGRFRREQFLQMPVLQLIHRREARENQIADLLRTGAVLRETNDFTFVRVCDKRRSFIGVTNRMAEQQQRGQRMGP